MKRGTYETNDYQKDTEDYSKYEVKKDVYLDEQQLYYDSGMMKQKKDWDDYTYDYEYEREGKDYKRASTKVNLERLLVINCQLLSV